MWKWYFGYVGIYRLFLKKYILKYSGIKYHDFYKLL